MSLPPRHCCVSPKVLSWAPAGSGPFQLRLLDPVLKSEETISSWLDRNAGFWGAPRRVLVTGVDIRLCGPRFDVDAFAEEGSRRQWLEAVGLSATALEKNRLHRPTLCQRPIDRLSYCPLCMYEDLRSNVFPYFRIDWARFFLTHCPQHRCPLYKWESVRFRDTRCFPHEWYDGPLQLSEKTPHWFRNHLSEAMKFATGNPPLDKDSLMLWDALMAFESLMLKNGVGSPGRGGQICLDPLLERKILGLCVLLLQFEDEDATQMPASVLRPEFTDHRLLSFTLKRFQARHTAERWKSVRSSLRNLPSRRGVLALVAHTLGFLGIPLTLSDGTIADEGTSEEWSARIVPSTASKWMWTFVNNGCLGTENFLRPWNPR